MSKNFTMNVYLGKYIELLGARNFLLVGSFIVAIGNIAFGFLSEVIITLHLRDN